MKTELGRLVILVNDYDEAFKFYEENLGCKKFFDLTDERGLRYLHIGFNSESIAGIWFLKAETDEQKKRVGNQTAGQPVFVLYTDSFEELLEKFLQNKIRVTKEPEVTQDAMSLNFLDLYGNEIVLVQLAKMVETHKEFLKLSFLCFKKLHINYFLTFNFQLSTFNYFDNWRSRSVFCRH